MRRGIVHEEKIINKSIILFTFIACGYMIYNPSNSNSTNDVQLTEKEKLEDFEYMYTIL